MVYTAIVGGRDAGRSDIKVFGDAGLFKDPRMEAKRYKVLAHLFVDDDVSVWVDGNIYLNVDEKELIRRGLGDADLAVFRRMKNVSVAQEVQELEGKGWRGFEALKKSRVYREEFQSALGGVIIRRGKATRGFNERWWSLICRYHVRDQVTLPTAIREEIEKGMRFRWIPGYIWKTDLIRFVPHTGV